MRKYNKSLSVTTTATNIVITFAPETALQDLQAFNFIICQRIPATGETLPVQFNINGTNYPLYDKYGNAATGAGLSTRKLYAGWFTSQGTAHFISPFVPDNFCSCGCGCNCNKNI